MKTKNIIMIATIVALTSVTACSISDDYLDVAPSKSNGIEISTVDQLAALLEQNSLDGGAYLSNALAYLFSTDCFSLPKDIYLKLKNDADPTVACQYFTWSMDKLSSENAKISEWGRCYEQIYLANLILNNIDNVAGSDEEKAKVAARAHALRAYSYFELALYYCQPYGASTLSEPGLPLKVTPDYEGDISRQSIEKTFEFIEKDIKAAYDIEEPLYKNDIRECWRENSAMVAALAARFYLYKGNYEEALKAAKKALTYDSDVLNLRTDVTLITESSLDLATFSFKIVSYPSTYKSSVYVNNRSIPNMDHAFYMRMHQTLLDNMPIMPSDYYLGLFDKTNDLRFKLFTCKSDISLFMSLLLPSLPVVPMYAKYVSDYFNYAPNTVEMYLIVAECQARTGKISEAMNTLKDFRATRYEESAPDEILNPSASSVEDAVKMIIDERTKEFAFTLRWYDMKRLNANDVTYDDVIAERNFFKVNQYSVETDQEVTYTFSPNNLKNTAVALPDSEITVSSGVIQQNNY